MEDKQETINNINDKLKHLDIPDLLERLYKNFGSDIIMTTAFGPSGIVLMYHLKEFAPKIPIYFIDTRKHSPETLALRDRIIKEWGLNIITVTPPSEAFVADAISNPDECCRLRKVIPLNRILRGTIVWISGIRRDQTTNRREIELVESKRGTIKINPLYNMTSKEIWEFIEFEGLPINPLLRQAGGQYASIGCQPCTSPGEYREDCRWGGSDKAECGMHLGD